MVFARPLLLILSFVLILCAAMALATALVAIGEPHEHLYALLDTAGICAVLGLLLLWVAGRRPFQLSSRQLYLGTTASWLLLSLVGAMPLYWLVPEMSFTDAVFESVSGLTTTGSTVLVDLDHHSHSVLLWRGLLQWVGGIGIIVLGIAILPFLKVGGMRLFRTESSDWSEKTLPRAGVMIRDIGGIYLTLTLGCLIAYELAGMGWFDALVHAMSTVSTGGYSNYDSSMGHFNDRPWILWIGALFMLLGSLPFLLFVGAFEGRLGPLLRDRQVRGFLGFTAVVACALALDRILVDGIAPFPALTHATFNVVSVITTTGYASQDYIAWSPFAVTLFFYITFIGGCSGSTAGGVKIFRFQVGWMMLGNQLRQMRHPQGVFVNRYNGVVVSDDITRSVIAFSFYFALTIALIALGLSLTGLDFLTSVSAAATAVANVGPGLGEVVGPAGNFTSLSAFAKWLLSAGMLLGRLEIMTVVILFTPMFWRS